jgi:ATP-binding cassette, subfamily B, multidrug efflux pump
VLRLWGYSRRYLSRYLLGGACLILTASLAMSIPYLLKRAIDAIQAGRTFSDVAFLAALIAAIAVAQGVVRTLSRALIFNVGRDVEFDLRNDLFAHLERLPVSYYQEQHTGDLMSRLINDVTAIRMLLGVGFLNLLNTPLYYAYGLTIMLALDAPLTVAALIPFPLLLFVVKRVSRRMMEQTLRVQEELSNLSSAVQENVAGIHVVRAYQAEDVAVGRFARSNDALTEQSLALARVRGQLGPIMRTASGLGTLVVICLGGTQVARGNMSLGDLVAFIGYLNLLAWPTMAMGWMLSVVQRGRAAMQRLEQIFAVEPAIADAADAQPLANVTGTIEYRNVGFAYANGGDPARVVDDVSFKLEPGQKLAIVGRTGAGKSTLVNLLPRLFDVSEGEILLDGRDIRRIPLRQLRGCIGFVPQDPFLFSTRIEDNIAFALDGGGNGASDRDRAVREAAEAAGVAGDIEAFPKGYRTVIGERGVTLSGGQKQRLTLARALASAPRILILDDALSSVDTRTEQAILSSLREQLDGKSSIVIAHRLSTVMDADLILVLDDGQVVERGDHASLLRKDGHYAQLFREQQLEEALETT